MHGNPLRLAFYGDDFTGATDTLATLATAGLRTLLFMGPPAPEQLAAAGPLDCLGIAGAARSMGNAEQQAEMEQVGRFLAGLDVPVVHYKTCSTYDSSPQVGSIGLAVRSLRAQLKLTSFTAFVGGQPNLGRYCVFGNLFAAFQGGGQAYRLDRHPTMRRHPVTPMHEADLRLHLAEQGLNDLGLMQYPGYDLPAAQTRDLLAAEIANHADGVLFDVGQASHLQAVGRAIWEAASMQPMLAVGPSSVAQALIAHWNAGRQGAATDSVAPRLGGPAPQGREDGAVFAFSGSRSPLTAGQLEQAESYLRIPLTPGALLDADGVACRRVLAQVTDALAQRTHVLVTVTEDPAPGQASTTELALACARFVAQVMALARPRRLGVAGGDTSSYIIQALNGWGLSYLGQLDPGVALCRLHSDDAALDGVEVMLKGGQMGSATVFQKLLDWTSDIRM